MPSHSETLAKLGESPLCIPGDNNNEMAVQLGMGFTIRPGDEIRLNITGSTFSNKLEAPGNNPSLGLEVFAPSRVSTCGESSAYFTANALVDGGAGKAPNISWTLVSVPNRSLREAIDSITSDASTKNSSVLSIPIEDYLRETGEYSIKVRAQDWLGTFAEKIFAFTVVADQSIPIVSAGSPQNITMRKNEPLELQLKAKVPSCNDANGGKVTISTSWTSDPIIQGTRSQRSLFFSLDPNTLSAGNTYRFTATVSSVQGTSTLGSSSLAFFVTVQEEQLGVYIKGGMRRTISITPQRSKTLTFAAGLATSELSPPPSVIYHWSVQNGAGTYLSLPQNTEEELSISTSLLQLSSMRPGTTSVYTVSVCASRSGTGATGSSNATQILEVVTVGSWSGEVPEVRLKRRMRSRTSSGSSPSGSSSLIREAAAPTEKQDIKNSVCRLFWPDADALYIDIDQPSLSKTVT
eukprot:jgi/Bigna1/126287/aug1.2_g995